MLRTMEPRDTVINTPDNENREYCRAYNSKRSSLIIVEIPHVSLQVSGGDGPLVCYNDLSSVNITSREEGGRRK